MKTVKVAIGMASLADIAEKACKVYRREFEVFRITREIHARPLEVIYALLSEDLRAEYKWRPCGVLDTQWIRYKTGTIKYEQEQDNEE